MHHKLEWALYHYGSFIMPNVNDYHCEYRSLLLKWVLKPVSIINNLLYNQNIDAHDSIIFAIGVNGKNK